VAVVVGVVGAGQLARMMAQAAIPLGVRLRVLARDEHESAAQVAPEVVVGSPDDLDALRRLAEGVDVVTFDHELVEPDFVRALEAEGVVVRPGAEVIATVVDKRRQREALARLHAPQPLHEPLDSFAQLEGFAAAHGWPVVLKAARGGYDGRGVWVAEDAVAAQLVWDGAVESGVALLVEEHVPIDVEVAVVVARRPGGQTVVYPAVQTVQVEGMLHELVFPPPVAGPIGERAEELARSIAHGIGAVGVLAVELFVSGDRLLVNELAARPHNSGHASIEGNVASQFENHLRAVLDWPLGDTAPAAPAFALVNVVGPADGSDPAVRLPSALSVPGLHPHLYGKAAKPGRKLGHVTAVGDDVAGLLARVRRGAALLHGEGEDWA
jgi:5-(carboxyamino)imidazole ribonucleotide synthase